MTAGHDQFVVKWSAVSHHAIWKVQVEVRVEKFKLALKTLSACLKIRKFTTTTAAAAAAAAATTTTTTTTTATTTTTTIIIIIIIIIVRLFFYLF